MAIASPATNTALQPCLKAFSDKLLQCRPGNDSLLVAVAADLAIFFYPCCFYGGDGIGVCVIASAWRMNLPKPKP